MGDPGRRGHLRLDGSAPRRRRSRALRGVGRVSQGALLDPGAQRGAVAGGQEPHQLRPVRGGEAVPAADADRSHPPLRALRRARRGGAHALPGVHEQPRGAAERRLSGPGVRGLQHSDPGADPFHGTRCRACRHRGRAQDLSIGRSGRLGIWRDRDAARHARRRQDHARGLLRRAQSRRLPGDLVDQGADRGRHARRSGGARGAARLGRRRRQGGAGAGGGNGAAAARGRRHPAHLRQCGGCRCGQALPAARRRLPGAGHLERAGLARDRHAGRGRHLAQDHRRRLSGGAHRPRRGARGGAGLVGGAGRTAARPRAGGRLLRAAGEVARRLPQAVRRRRRRDCSTMRATRRPSITTV